MLTKKICLLAATILLACFNVAAPQDGQYVTRDGKTYYETRQKIMRPVQQTTYEERERTVYREQYTTTVEESQRVIHLPVTEYRWEAQWHGRWNPFVQPYLAYRLVPRTTWEPRAETVRVPVTQRNLVPARVVERIPVTSRQMVEEEVIRRTAVLNPPTGVRRANDPFATGESRVVRRPVIGGVSELKSDPPRAANGSEWRSVVR
ncbi:MAG: hypothetical protein MPJ50_10720 [Pirellulales bacterium]|nr:hypothetical protein [Pirellulales bacterium]